MESAEAPVRVGEIVAGKYRVEKVLGAGAMGMVVAATHVDLLEVRAIKFLQASMVGDADIVERFLREARAAVRLKSQHVARVHDVGRLSTGAPYIVMEHLQGADLKAVLEARGVLPAAEAAAYLGPGVRGALGGARARDRPPGSEAGEPLRDPRAGRRAVREDPRFRDRQDHGWAGRRRGHDCDQRAARDAALHVARADARVARCGRAQRHLGARGRPLPDAHRPHALRRQQRDRDLRGSGGRRA